MTSLVDPTDTKRAAFRRGFWKGMAAPVMLFSSFDLPAQARPLEFVPLARRASAPGSEWVKVGQALREAAAKERENFAK